MKIAIACDHGALSLKDKLVYVYNAVAYNSI